MSEFVKLLKTSLKLISLVVLTIVCLIALILFWNNYQDEEITMISMECNWDIYSSGNKDYLEWYLIKKKRNENIPYAMYRGAYLQKIIGDKKIFIQNYLTNQTQDYYYFGIDETPSIMKGHRIDRRTLDTQYWDGEAWTTAKCKEISEEEFYLKIEPRIKEKKKGIIF